MNLPETYAAVCAKRPELAVDELFYDECWEVSGNGCLCLVVKTETAAALILARWVEALPDGMHLVVRGSFSYERRWTVYPSFPELDYYSTPLEALAAYWLEGTT